MKIEIDISTLKDGIKNDNHHPKLIKVGELQYDCFRKIDFIFIGNKIDNDNIWVGQLFSNGNFLLDVENYHYDIDRNFLLVMKAIFGDKFIPLPNNLVQQN